ncbi:MAG: FAD-dependent oxidoreductase [Pontiellaceae bacterium]|nr:FAD-dependent oxidoreductase [Pontiellaceae bacterium]MBN2783722.1 FAD-dependent oxidoreductase [Pontiellaceae bacterium]
MNSLREHCLGKAGACTQDVLVVGGGINGAVSAAALAAGGAKITLIDKGDFASCTSQESSNLAWGGIKYLESYEFGLVWKLCRSRNRLMKAYPEQVREIRFYTSIAKGFRKPRLLIYLGAVLYWFMGRCRTRPPRLLSRNAIRREAPMVNADHLAGGIEYSDCHFVNNDAHFTFGFIRRMLEKGGAAINYAELIAAEHRDGIWHCTLRDHAAGVSFNLQSRIIINAAGPYVDRINTLLGSEGPFRHLFSKGAHIIVPRITETGHVLTFFASDGRLFFMIPMGRRTCIGTTDTRVDHETAEPTTDDVQFLLDNANALLRRETPLTKNDVIATRCGVRPLVVRKEHTEGKADWTALSRKHELDVHTDLKTISIYGGKLTDCLNVGDEIADLAESFGIPIDRSKVWFGESGESTIPDDLDEIARMEPSEIRRIVDEAMVVHLDDFLRRRTRLELTTGRNALRTHPGLIAVAQIIFGTEADTELDRYFEKRR